MRVIVTDDSMLTREGIVRILRGSGVEVVGQADDGSSLGALVHEHRDPGAVSRDRGAGPVATSWYSLTR